MKSSRHLFRWAGACPPSNAVARWASPCATNATSSRQLVRRETSGNENRHLQSQTSRFLALAVLVAIIALRLLFVLHYRVDSDEPQHLHVVWGWTHSLVQYRDIPDNHTPFFHLVCTPLFKWFGERPDVLIFMRLAMIPLYFFSLWCIYRLGTIVQSREVGWWAAIFGALSPALCFTSTEFRADDLWASLWFASLVVLLGGAPTWKRGLLSGFLFGVTIVTSLKTLALIGCLGGATITGLLLRGKCMAVLKRKSTYHFIVPLLVGCAVFPAVLALGFIRLGAFHDAIFGIFTYNAVPGMGRMHTRRDFIVGLVEFVLILGLLIPLSAQFARRFIAPYQQFRFQLIFLSGGFYGALIYTLWPLLDAEHLIPLQPLIALSLTPPLLQVLKRSKFLQRDKWRDVALTVAAFTVMLVEAHAVKKDEAARWIRRSAELLRLSNSSDYVLDLKGETVFRQRPCKYLFEGVGVERARRGMVPDDLPEQMIRTKTCITIPTNYRFILPRTLAFIDENYIGIGGYRVLGHDMMRKADSSSLTFVVVIPETFAFVSADKVISGTIDGKPCRGFAELTTGIHKFVPDRPYQQVSFVWKQAIDRGFYPKKRSRDLSFSKPNGHAYGCSVALPIDSMDLR